jgi:hypothetical protein
VARTRAPLPLRPALRVGVIAMTALGLTGLVAPAAIASPPDRSPVAAVAAHTGHRLPADPVLHDGEQIVLTATGFAAGADVTVGLVGERLLVSVTADGRGAAVYTFSVPDAFGSGEHSLVFSGAVADLSNGSTGGNIQVGVPLTEQWPFRLPGRPTSSPHGVSGTEVRSTLIANTGTDLAALVKLALLVTIGGVALLVTGARRARLSTGMGVR